MAQTAALIVVDMQNDFCPPVRAAEKPLLSRNADLDRMALLPWQVLEIPYH